MKDAKFSLNNKIALVTGASRGLGFEIAKGLWEAGATVLLNGRNQTHLIEAIAQISESGERLKPARFDVAITEQIDDAFQGIEAEHGRLDILINNVGIRDRRGLLDFEMEAVERMWTVNLKAPFYLAQKAARLMVAQKNGRIINITSIAGPIARKDDTVYTVVKGGLASLTRALAADLGQYNITVNGIAPGYFATETNAPMVENGAALGWLKQRTSLGRWGKPEEIAGTAVFLASSAASYITGHILAVDGGYLAHW